MPQAPRHPCRFPGGCVQLIPAGERYCPGHRGAAEKLDRQRRGSSTHRGYGAGDWGKYSLDFRNRFPLCGMRPPEAEARVKQLGVDWSRCKREGRLTPVLGKDKWKRPRGVTDHVIPVQEGRSDPLFWDLSNHQSLCTPCHNYKRAHERMST